MLPIAAAALLVVGLPLASAFAPCCAYNGDGSVVLLGAGVLNAFSPPRSSNVPLGPAYAAPMALGVSTAGSFATVLFAAQTGPEDAVAGWIVTSNATNDVIFTFTNITGTPQCTGGVAPRGSMVPDYGMCAGSGTFPKHSNDYKVAGLTVGVFEQSQGTTSEWRVPASSLSVLHAPRPFNTDTHPSFPTRAVSFADEKACVPLAMLGSTAPFGTGAYSVNVESGVGAAPPQSWSAPPSWCEGHWVTSA
jgi:hypothetical protein